MENKKGIITNFYVKPENVGKERLRIEGKEAKHIAKVLRHHKGEIIQAVDGLGTSFKIVLDKVGTDFVEGQIVSRIRKANEPVVQLTLAQSIPKGLKMDWVVEKATEIGVSSIIPLITENTAIEFKGEQKEKRKLDRWRRIAIASMKQSLRSVLPQIQKPIRFDELISQIQTSDLSLIASLEKNAKSLNEVLNFQTSPRKILLIVGPEMGFSEEELDQAEKYGVIPIRLGYRRLRSETAGIIFSSLVLYELEDLG